MRYLIFAAILITSCKPDDPKPADKNPYSGQSKYIRYTINGNKKSCNLPEYSKISQGFNVSDYKCSGGSIHIEYDSITKIKQLVYIGTGSENFRQIKDSFTFDFNSYENYRHGTFSGFLRSDDRDSIIHITNGEYLVIVK